MEHQTATQVSKTFGISTRMLRYYEQVGLVKSLRKDDYSYRVYDGENLKRLQQIVILRKLQIPIKQITIILNNPDTATAIEIFNENIATHKNEITALETIKAALEIFVAKIEELATVRLNMNLLTDDTVIELAQSLSLTQKNVKEYQTMEQLNQVSEAIKEKRARELLIRYVNMRPMRVLSTYLKGTNRTENFHKDEDAEKVWNKEYKRVWDEYEKATGIKYVEYYGEHFEGHSDAGHVLTKRIPDDCINDTPYEDYILDGLFIVETTSDRFAGYDPGELWETMSAWLKNCDYLEPDNLSSGGQRDLIYGCQFGGKCEAEGAMWDLFVPVKYKPTK